MTPARLRAIAEAYVAEREASREMLRAVLRRRVRGALDADVALDDEARGAALDPLHEAIEAEIARLVALGLVDDARYAAMKARRGYAMGRGARRIARDLKRKGIDEDTARAALDAAAREPLERAADEPGPLADRQASERDAAEHAAALRHARRRRLGPFREAPPPEDRDAALRLRRREAGSLARAGFSAAVARAVLDLDPIEAGEGE
ncbi:MAG: RecX family transcriptional regulator [Paracoccaceae bacterium]